MKAILEFNLPEDNYEYEMARNGAVYASALSELQEWLRTTRKHSDLSGKTAADVLEEVWDELHALLPEGFP